MGDSVKHGQRAIVSLNRLSRNAAVAPPMPLSAASSIVPKKPGMPHSANQPTAVREEIYRLLDRSLALSSPLVQRTSNNAPVPARLALAQRVPFAPKPLAHKSSCNLQNSTSA